MNPPTIHTHVRERERESMGGDQSSNQYVLVEVKKQQAMPTKPGEIKR